MTTINETFPNSDTLLWEALPDLTLNIAQTAALCGISVRQLGYWTRQGYVTAQGRGARRTYGLEAVRRVLAIRKAMDGGASLRQALRLVGSPETRPAPSSLPASPAGASVMPALPPDEADAIAQDLREFFDDNKFTRDHAAGLAVKLGRAEEDVRVVAERLCGLEFLVKTVCQGMTVFRQAGPEAVHA